MKEAFKPLAWAIIPLAVIAIALLSKEGSVPGEQRSRSDTIEADTPDLPPPLHNRQTIASQVFFLFDASGSFHRGDEGALSRSIPLLRKTVEHWGRQPFLSPTRVLVGTIGSLSLQQQPICDFQVYSRGPFDPPDAASLATHTTQCEKRLQNLPTEPNTDITGALQYASVVFRSRREIPRAVVLVTDLLEDLPAGHQVAEPDLSGMCVSVVLEFGSTDPGNPEAVDARLAEWESRTARYGANGYEYWHRVGYDPSELTEFLLDCSAGR